MRKSRTDETNPRLTQRHVFFLLGLLVLSVSAIVSVERAEAVMPLANEFDENSGAELTNDNFDSATTIEDLPSTALADTTLATTEPGEPLADCPNILEVSNTVWYSYTPEDDVHVRADTIGSNFSPVVAVYRGSSLAELDLVSCGFAGLAPVVPETNLVFEASAGQSYLIQVGGSTGATPFGGQDMQQRLDWQPWEGGGKASPAGAGSGSLTLNLAEFTMPACPVPTESFADPSGDTFGFGTTQHDITSVGVGLDEDTLCLTVDFAGPIGAFEDGEDVAAIMAVSIDADADPSTGEPGLFSEFCGPSSLGIESLAILSSGFGLLAPVVSDISFEGYPDVSFATALYGDTTIDLAIPLMAVGGDGDLGFSVIVGTEPEPTDCAPNGGSIECQKNGCSAIPPPPPPSNDDFENAQVIPGAQLSKEGSTAAATTQVAEPAPCAGIARTVWYTFTPTQDSFVVVDTFGSDFDTVLAVYTGGELGSLVDIACNDDAGGLESRVEFAARAGQNYHIQVGGFFGDGGVFELHVMSEAVPSQQTGDVNCDGTATSLDAAFVLQYGAGFLPSLLCQDAADVNLDGLVNSIDAALILQFTAGLLDGLPV